MPLQSIDEQGNIQWVCTWRPYQKAPDCGALNTYHINHDAVRWVNTNVIELPSCVKCGGIMSVRIPSEEEMTPPIVTRQEDTGHLYLTHAPGYEHFHTHWNVRTERVDGKNVVREVSPQPWVVHHQELARQLVGIGKVHTPAPEPAPTQLTPEQLQQVINHLQSQGLLH